MRSIIHPMSEFVEPQPFEMLKEHYLTTEPNFWAIKFFDQTIYRAQTPEEGGGKVPSTKFITNIYEEVGNLVLDMDLKNNPKKHRKTVGNLLDRGRIDPVHQEELHSIGKQEYSNFIDALKMSSAEKLVALTEYLAHQGNLIAVPLAFLTGRTRAVFSYEFMHYGEQEKEPASSNLPYKRYYRNDDENRGQIIRKAQKLLRNGGCIIFPYENGRGRLNALVEPWHEGKFATTAFGSIPLNIESRLRINDHHYYYERQILAMLHPREIIDIDDE